MTNAQKALLIDLGARTMALPPDTNDHLKFLNAVLDERTDEVLSIFRECCEYNDEESIEHVVNEARSIMGLPPA